MATLTVKYSPLVTASIMQLFYNNQICAAYQTVPQLDFTIVPTAECLAYMKTKGMVFKNTDTSGGFIVMAATLGKNGSGNDLLKKPIANSDKLSFLMVLQNPNLVNFDVLPTQVTAGNIYYFSNQVKDNAALRTNLHLTKAAAGVDGTKDQVKKSGTPYTYNYPGVINTSNAKVKHLLTGAIVGAGAVTVQGTQSKVAFDLTGLPSGMCQLLVNNTIIDTFYYLGTMANQPVFGVIELSLSTALPANYRIVETDQSLLLARPNYTVLFKNRATIWRYTIQLQTNSPLYVEMSKLPTPADKANFIKDLSIGSPDNDPNIKFKLASNTDLSFVFVSVNNMALREKYISSTSTTNAPLIIELYKNTTTNKTTVKTSLPYPSTTVIDAGSLPTIYSDVFISL